MHDVLHRLWFRVQEPRKQPVVYFPVYLGVTVLEPVIILDLPRCLQGTRS